MKYCLFIMFLTVSAFGQIDTTKTIYKNLKTKKFYSVNMSANTRNGKTEYFINNNLVSYKLYKKYYKTWKNMETCTPCILMSYNENNLLLSKVVSYTDCNVGKYIKYFSNGNIEVIGHYKENNTGLWENLYENGLCSIKDGIWNYYDENGIIVKVEIYKNNKLIIK